MEKLELNVIESFRLVKSDIIRLQNVIAGLSQNQERLMEWIQDTRDKENNLYHGFKDVKHKAEAALKAKKSAVSHKKAAKRFVASKSGKTVHESNCPYAKNIKPKSKIIFHSKAKALNLGYKACECIKRI